ncbi:ubiquitin-like protein [Trypanosoma rangeli]|uniref:Ubiquitin-like protein n=1 Tax=Trypanosoma rangeli TaxID=5698 RepID=A0A422P276_TRYRA|nr:ubiquitin-like protein [Trypanosoma rangeli]RNF11833.1 ubiquitin-like protein [Trypanosoma rangeli]|eukprot:RNF11833.1 ubiquitin-like protein [Trypanosoma rangeli]
MSVTIKLSNGTQKIVEVPDLNISVSRFKEIASSVTNIPADEQRVVFRGRVLKDGDILSEMGMEHGQAVHIVRGQKSITPQVPPPSTQQSTSVQDTQINTAAQARPEAVNPYAALAANSPAIGGFPTNNPGNAYAGMPFSPEFLSTVLQNPAFMQYMETMMRDPQFLQQAMPQAQSQSQFPFGANEGVQRALNNPAFMQLALQMMREPSVMQQMAQSLRTGFPALNTPSFGQQNTQPTNNIQGAGFSQPHGNTRDLYQTQLQQLRDMGFPNEQANLAALEQAHGNIDFAIERLLNM